MDINTQRSKATYLNIMSAVIVMMARIKKVSFRSGREISSIKNDIISINIIFSEEDDTVVHFIIYLSCNHNASLYRSLVIAGSTGQRKCISQFR